MRRYPVSSSGAGCKPVGRKASGGATPSRRNMEKDILFENEDIQVYKEKRSEDVGLMFGTIIPIYSREVTKRTLFQKIKDWFKWYWDRLIYYPFFYEEMEFPMWHVYKITDTNGIEQMVQLLRMQKFGEPIPPDAVDEYFRDMEIPGCIINPEK